MEIGQLDSGSIDAYWVSESTTLSNRYITPETALTTDFSAAAGGMNSTLKCISYLWTIISSFVTIDLRHGKFNFLSSFPWKQLGP